MAGQGKYKRCDRKNCRTKATGVKLKDGSDYCEPHLMLWAVAQIHGLDDYGLALGLFIESRVREIVRQATNQATTQAG